MLRTATMSNHTRKRRGSMLLSVSRIAPFSSGTISNRKSDLNPPRTTLAADLSLPNKDDYSSSVRYYMSAAKSYFKFYKIGLSAVRTNRKLLRERLAVAAHSPWNSRVGTFLLTLTKPNAKYVNEGDMSRADWILWHRVRHDSVRVPMFGVLLAIFWELTPFVVLALSDVVPRTCRTPSQLEKDRRKLEARRQMSLNYRYLITFKDLNKPETYFRNTHVLRSVNLVGKVWDKPTVAYVVTPLFWSLRGAPHVSFLRRDDDLLRDSSKNLSELSTDEVRDACEMRGIDVCDVDDEQLRKKLQKWLQRTDVKDELKEERVASLIGLSRTHLW